MTSRLLHHSSKPYRYELKTVVEQKWCSWKVQPRDGICARKADGLAIESIGTAVQQHSVGLLHVSEWIQISNPRWNLVGESNQSGSSKFIKQTNKTQSLGTFRLKEQNHWKKKKGFHASKNTTIIKILLLAKHRLTRTTETEKQNRIQRSIVLFYKRENHQRLLLLQPYAEVPAVVGWSRTCSAPGSREGGK